MPTLQLLLGQFIARFNPLIHTEIEKKMEMGFYLTRPVAGRESIQNDRSQSHPLIDVRCKYLSPLRIHQLTWNTKIAGSFCLSRINIGLMAKRMKFYYLVKDKMNVVGNTCVRRFHSHLRKRCIFLRNLSALKTQTEMSKLVRCFCSAQITFIKLCGYCR